MDAIPSRPTVTTTRPRFRDKGRAFLAVPRAVPTCRRITRAGLFAHGLADLSDDACAVTTELASNAVSAMQIEQQTGRLGSLPPIMVLSLEWMTAGARIGIWDDSPGIPDIRAIRAPAGDAETGGGLFIVDALTAGRWGWFAAGTGKCVWAEIVRAAAGPVSLT
jgi:serine/threonine-protein kinase RsbW